MGCQLSAVIFSLSSLNYTESFVRERVFSSSAALNENTIKLFLRSSLSYDWNRSLLPVLHLTMFSSVKDENLLRNEWGNLRRAHLNLIDAF